MSDTEQEDLINLNLDEEQQQTTKPAAVTKTTETGAILQEGEEDFNPNDYGGYPMEAWNKYVGAINDKQQARTANLARYQTYTVRINVAKESDPYPVFEPTIIQYYAITKKAWEKRRLENSEVEDLQRQLQVLTQHLAEQQESLRLRIFARNKPRGIVTNREDPSKAQLEEIQENMKFYEGFSTDIGTRLSKKKQESDLYAFQMYFHKDKDFYDEIMNEDIDDLLRACDHKQIYGSANLRLSKSGSSLVASPGTS